HINVRGAERAVRRNGSQGTDRSTRFPEIFIYRFHAAPDMQLLVNVPDMRANGFDADLQRIRNFLVLISPGELAKNLLLAFCQIVGWWRCGRWLAKKLNHFAGDGIRHRSAARMNMGDALKALRQGRLLDEVTAGTRFQRIKNFIILR